MSYSTSPPTILSFTGFCIRVAPQLTDGIRKQNSMNRRQGTISCIGVMVLISLLLFNGVASAAMLCCGPDHNSHTQSSSALHGSASADHQSTDHQSTGHHLTEHSITEHQSADHQRSTHYSAEHSADSLHHHAEPPEQQYDSTQIANEHQSSCSSCAVSCTTAVLLWEPSDMLSEFSPTERIVSLCHFLLPLTSSGLERPPRLYS